MIVRRKSYSPDGKVFLRVVLNSAEHVCQALVQVKSLETYKIHVYISRDMTFFKRNKIRELVHKMKELIQEQPQNQWTMCK